MKREHRARQMHRARQAQQREREGRRGVVIGRWRGIPVIRKGTIPEETRIDRNWPTNLIDRIQEGITHA